MDVEPDRAAMERVFRLFVNLNLIAPPDESALVNGNFEAKKLGATYDPERCPAPYLRFCSEAREAFLKWRKDNTAKANADSQDPQMKLHLLKYDGMVASLAAIFHVINVADALPDLGGWDGARSLDVGPDDDGVVTLDELNMAISWATYLESHARRIYSITGEGKNEVVGRLLAKIRAGELDSSLSEYWEVLPPPPDVYNPPARIGRSFRIGDVEGKKWEGLRTNKEVVPALDQLVALGWLYRTEEKTPRGAPTKVRYWISPACVAERENQRYGPAANAANAANDPKLGCGAAGGCSS